MALFSAPLLAAIQKRTYLARTDSAQAAGHCYRLYTESTYAELDQDTSPEILRCDLSSAILTMKARGVDDILNFPFLTPPKRESLEKALLHLYQLGALDDSGRISAAGKQIARLPLTPALGRVIIAAAEEGNCVEEVIDIVAALSVENIWLSAETEEAREKATVARQGLLSRQGDHLSLLNAVRGFAGEASDRRRWAEDRLVSFRAMQSVMDVRKQLLAQCRLAGLLESTSTSPSEGAVSEEVGELVLRAFLRGFAGNTARLCPDGSYKVSRHLSHPTLCGRGDPRRLPYRHATKPDFFLETMDSC